MKRYCFIGCVNLKRNLFDGQTLKTRLIYTELKKRTDWKIFLVDTYLNRKHKILLLLKSVWGLLFYKNIIVMLSNNGRPFYFKLFNFFMKFKKLNIHHEVIGGNFALKINENPKMINIVNKFKSNIVETKKMINQLEEAGVINSILLPNFRLGKPLNKPLYKESNVFDFVIFSRIMKEKGITNAINTLSNFQNVSLDIYGPIDQKYKNEFTELISKYHFVKYKGIANREEVMETLSKKFALLFPTLFECEGFPGTIVDAFYCGLPVIASNRGSNSEIIENYKNGILFDIDSENGFRDVIKSVIENPKLVNRMRVNCLESAGQYSADINMNKLIDILSR